MNDEIQLLYLNYASLANILEKILKNKLMSVIIFDSAARGEGSESRVDPSLEEAKSEFEIELRSIVTRGAQEFCLP